ncbi:MAG: hypothetical protein ACJ8C4_14065 [Gemmataceae bacterium]
MGIGLSQEGVEAQFTLGKTLKMRRESVPHRPLSGCGSQSRSGNLIRLMSYSITKTKVCLQRRFRKIRREEVRITNMTALVSESAFSEAAMGKPQNAALPVTGTASPDSKTLAWINRWSGVWQMLQGIGAILALAVSLYAVNYVIQQTKTLEAEFAFNLKKVQEDAKEKEQTNAAERVRFRHLQTARMVDDMNKFDVLFATYPYITEYHERAYSDDPKEAADIRAARLRKQFASETGDRKRVILTSVEMLANFMDGVLLQKDTLDPSDWNRWYNSFMDNYDENPILQDFLEMRADWYGCRNVLRDKKNRQAFYLPGESRRQADHPCFK